MALCLLLTTFTYAQPPGWLVEEVVPDYRFTENLGQVFDFNGNTQPTVLFYTGSSKDGVFFLEEERIRVAHLHTNTISKWRCRVDVMMVCGSEEVSCGTIQGYVINEETRNFYNENAPDGITDVRSYKTLVHSGAFDDINVIYNGNSKTGFKTTFEVLPGGNVGDIKLLFEGQSSLSLDANGNIIAAVETDPFVFKQLHAHQLDATGTLVPLGWSPSWSITGDEAELTNIGAYDNTKELYLTDEPLNPTIPTGLNIPANQGVEWSTRYGAARHSTQTNTADFMHEQGGTIRVDDATGDIYHTMVRPYDAKFQPMNGCEQEDHAGESDIFISKFEKDTYKLIWDTYFGGDKKDFCTKTALSNHANSQHLYLTGWTEGALPLPTQGNPNLGTFKQTTNHGGKDAFIASFDKTSGARQWITLYGGAGDEEAKSITIDDVGHKLYIVGVTRNSTSSTPPTTIGCITSSGTGFPLCNGGGGRYYQTTFGSVTAEEEDGFIAEFDIDQNNNSLEWSTLFGGNHSDIVYDVLKVNHTGEEALYICGFTRGETSSTSFPSPITAPATAGDFPLASPNTNAYVQYTNGTSNDDEGFIAKFDVNSKLIWSTTFGGRGQERFTALATNSENHDLYAIGYTTTKNTYLSNRCTPLNSANGSWPVCKDPIAGTYNDNQIELVGSDGVDIMITRFRSNGQLKWSTYFGGKGEETTDGSQNQTVDRLVLAQMDDVDNLYIYSTSEWRKFNPTPTTPVKNAPGNHYNQAINASQGTGVVEYWNPTRDVFVAAFSPQNVFTYGTYFGGTANNGGVKVSEGISDEYASDFDISGHHGIYITGKQACVNTPAFEPPAPGYFKPFSDRAPGDFNLFITRLNGSHWWHTTHVPTSMEESDTTDLSTSGVDLQLRMEDFDGVITIAPNPVAGVFVGRYYSKESGPVNVRILNSLGQTVKTLDLTAVKGENIFNVSLDGNAAGIYYLEMLRNENQKQTIKFIKD